MIVNKETKRLIEVLIAIALQQSRCDMLGESPKNDTRSGVNYYQTKLRITNGSAGDRGRVARCPPATRNLFSNKKIGEAYFED
jgi:hypothetical protein